MPVCSLRTFTTETKTPSSAKRDLPALPGSENWIAFCDYDLIVFDAASQVTGFCRKYDSFAM